MVGSNHPSRGPRQLAQRLAGFRDPPMGRRLLLHDQLSSDKFIMTVTKKGEGDGGTGAPAEPMTPMQVRQSALIPPRTGWEHSIPGIEALRYSITFRNFKSD